MFYEKLLEVMNSIRNCIDYIICNHEIEKLQNTKSQNILH